MGSSWECLCFVFRAIGAKNQQESIYVIISALLLLLAPLCTFYLDTRGRLRSLSLTNLRTNSRDQCLHLYGCRSPHLYATTPPRSQAPPCSVARKGLRCRRYRMLHRPSAGGSMLADPDGETWLTLVATYIWLESESNWLLLLLSLPLPSCSIADLYPIPGAA